MLQPTELPDNYLHLYQFIFVNRVLWCISLFFISSFIPICVCVLCSFSGILISRHIVLCCNSGVSSGSSHVSAISRVSRLSVASVASSEVGQKSSKLRLRAVPRPESLRRAAGESLIASDEPDCTLVGYRKVDISAIVYRPTIELGTLTTPDSAHAQQSLVGSGVVVQPSLLFNAVSLPTLLHANAADVSASLTGSMPTLTPAANESSSSESELTPYWLNQQGKAQLVAQHSNEAATTPQCYFDSDDLLAATVNSNRNADFSLASSASSDLDTTAIGSDLQRAVGNDLYMAEGIDLDRTLTSDPATGCDLDAAAGNDPDTAVGQGNNVECISENAATAVISTSDVSVANFAAGNGADVTEPSRDSNDVSSSITGDNLVISMSTSAGAYADASGLMPATEQHSDTSAVSVPLLESTGEQIGLSDSQSNDDGDPATNAALFVADQTVSSSSVVLEGDLSEPSTVIPASLPSNTVDATTTTIITTTTTATKTTNAAAVRDLATQDSTDFNLEIPAIASSLISSSTSQTNAAADAGSADNVASSSSSADSSPALAPSSDMADKSESLPSAAASSASESAADLMVDGDDAVSSEATKPQAQSGGDAALSDVSDKTSLPNVVANSGSKSVTDLTVDGDVGMSSAGETVVMSQPLSGSGNYTAKGNGNDARTGNGNDTANTHRSGSANDELNVVIPSSSDSLSDDERYLSGECTLMELIVEDNKRFGVGVSGSDIAQRLSRDTPQQQQQDQQQQQQHGDDDADDNGDSTDNPRRSRLGGSSTAMEKSLSVAALSSSKRRLISVVSDDTIHFIGAKEKLRKQLNYSGHFYRSLLLAYLLFNFVIWCLLLGHPAQATVTRSLLADPV